MPIGRRCRAGGRGRAAALSGARALSAALVSALALAGAGAVARAETFSLADGRRLELAPVAGMSCAQLAAKLAEIDATGYRGASPEPRHRADRRLFEYENQVSIRYYSECVAIGGAPSGSPNVFRGGFNADAPAAD